MRPAGQTLPLETLVERLHRARPTDRLHSIYSDFKPDWALNFRTVAANGDRIHSFIDPYRGTMLGSIDYNHSALQWVYDLHSDLKGERIGLAVNAWFAFALAIASTAGLLLWWRGSSYWGLGFEYRIHASWKRQVWDLHDVGGFCFYLPLLLLSLSGAYFAFEPGYASITAALTGSAAVVAAPKATRPGAARRSLDEIQQSGLRALPGSAPSMIIFPAKRGDTFTLRLRLP